MEVSKEIVRKRRWRRRLWALLILAAVLGGLRIAYLIHRGPLLTPVTRDLLPANCGLLYNGTGYPALRAAKLGDNNSPFPLSDAAWLDERCRPVPGEAVPCTEQTVWLSREGNIAGWVEEGPVIILPDADGGFSTPTCRYVLCRRDGMVIRFPFRDVPIAEDALSMRGIVQIVLLDKGPVIGSGSRAYTLNGRLIAFPKTGNGAFGASRGVLSLDPRYIVIERYPEMPCYWYNNGTSSDGYLHLYDIQQQRIVRSFSDKHLGGLGNVLVHGSRFLAVPWEGEAYIFSAGQPPQAMGTKQTTWFVGSDETVWAVEGGSIKVLHWREGAPRLEATGIPLNVDNRFGSEFDDLRSAPAAVHGDGALVARLETVSRLSDGRARWVEGLLRKVKVKKVISREERRLTLYNHGKRLGTFTVRLKPLERGTSYPEHLAFTKDGRHLAWVIDAGIGKQVYVFATGQ